MNLNWLTARPIAHRGQHDRARGIIENSFAAAECALASGCAIECDVRMSSDGEAFVFHDETLDRLTSATGLFRDTSSEQLAHMQLSGSARAASIPTLGAFLERVGGRVPLIIEIKSLFDGDMRLAERTALIAAQHAGSVALKSFDPAIVSHLRRSSLSKDIPLGLVAQARFDHAEWAFLSDEKKQSMACLLHWRETRPDFLSFSVHNLPHAAITLARAALHMPVMTWTVRTSQHWDIARRYADQAIFEGPLP